LDIKKGMQYIKKALQYAPDSAFYLDSLAWGYYKLHQCQKAHQLFQKIATLQGGDDPEVVKHIKAVEKCLHHQKGKNK
jgi:Tfp pilus assembly protein PilF